jgi:hypothetical protein
MSAKLCIRLDKIGSELPMTIKFLHPEIGGLYGFYSQAEAQARLAQPLSGYGTKLGRTLRLDGLSPRPHHPTSATFALKATQV